MATKALKLANRLEGKQGEVWKRVEMAQKQLKDNLKTEVKDAKSVSSLQLSLENKKLLENIDSYIKKLSSCVDGKNDVVGFAFAINGQVNSADVYAANGLFKKLWPKLLKASAVEAVAELKQDKTFPAVTADQVKAFMADAAKGKLSEKEVTKRLQQLLNDNDDSCLFQHPGSRPEERAAAAELYQEVTPRGAGGSPAGPFIRRAACTTVGLTHGTSPADSADCGGRTPRSTPGCGRRSRPAPRP